MMAAEQLPLALPGIVPVPRQPTLAEQWAAFHAANPHVLELFISEALALRRAGHKRGGAKMIWERLRWIYATSTATEGAYRLNNNLTCFYARAAMRAAPALVGFFATRERRAK